MKIDKKKDFKKKFVLCSTLIEAEEPLKIILDDSFVNACINFKIPIKEDLAKLINRKHFIMTTKCICNDSKFLNEETTYAMKKITRYKCNHGEGDQKKLNETVSTLLDKLNKKGGICNPQDFFENSVNLTHNFDNIYNMQKSIKTNKNQSEEPKKQPMEKMKNENRNGEENEPKEKQQMLSESIKCILDLVKNNNEKKFFVGTNKSELRTLLRKIFLVPIMYINDSGTLKMENLSTKNENKKKRIELKKMKIPKWERDMKRIEKKRNQLNEDNQENNYKQKKKKKKKVKKNIHKNKE